MKRILYYFLAFLFLLTITISCDKIGLGEGNETEKEASRGPKAVTLDSIKGDYGTALLSGKVSGLEAVALDFECGIEISTNASFSKDSTWRVKADVNYSENTYTVDVRALKSGQKYYYRAYYINQLLLYYGTVKQFSFEWENENAGLIGTWISMNNSYEYIFSADYTGISSYQGRTLKFIWELNANELELQFKSENGTKTAYQTFIIQSITDTLISMYDINDRENLIELIKADYYSAYLNTLKERETNQIQQWLTSHNINVISLSDFLKDTITNNPVTGPNKNLNEFVLLDNGVYLQIVRRGEGRIIQPGEIRNYYARFIEVSVAKGDTMTMNIYQQEPDNVYIHRIGDNYTASFYGGIMASKYGEYVPNAWIMSFPFIKPGTLNGQPSARVHLIVPHTQGTKTAAKYVYPTYYEIILTTPKYQ